MPGFRPYFCPGAVRYLSPFERPGRVRYRPQLLDVGQPREDARGGRRGRQRLPAKPSVVGPPKRDIGTTMGCGRTRFFNMGVKHPPRSKLAHLISLHLVVRAGNRRRFTLSRPLIGFMCFFLLNPAGRLLTPSGINS